MYRIRNRLFLTNLFVILLGSLILEMILRMTFRDFFILVLGGTLIAFVSSLIIWEIFLKPIRQMQKVTEKITRGDFQSRLALARKDELGDLANSLNQLSLELQEKIMEIMQDKNELKAIVSSMEEGVIVIGRDERIILLNSPVYRMLDLRTKETIGRPYWEVIRNEEVNSLIKEALGEKKSLKKEITIISPQESFFSMQISSVLFDGGELSGIVVVFHDITELKKLERMRSDFVANVSHELKTPLTSIKGFVETLKDGAIHDQQKAKKFLEIIQRHAERLEHLVNDLLSLSVLESKGVRLEFEKEEISSLIESVVQFFKKQLENHKHKIVINIAEDLPRVLIDRVKMEEAFSNLLDNAIKFTPPGGVITINAFHENGFIRVDFKDTGVGIATEHLPRIFERFYRVDKGRSRELGGTGLGLSIVKHIVQTHNGKVSVHSELDKGSTFSIYLPQTSS